MCLAAVYEYPYALEFVENQTKEVCIVALLQKPQVIELIRNEFRTKALDLLILKYVPKLLSSINDLPLFSHGLILKALKKNPKAIKKLSLKTEDMIRTVLEIYPNYIQYIENPSEYQCILAVSKSPSTLKFIANQTPEICKSALSSNVIKEHFRKSSVFKYILNPTQELCDYAILECGFDASVIPEEFINKKIVEYFFKNNNFVPKSNPIYYSIKKFFSENKDLELDFLSITTKAFKFISNPSSEICLSIIKSIPDNIIYITDYNQTLDQCIIALRQTDALNYCKIYEHIHIVENPDYENTLHNLLMVRKLQGIDKERHDHFAQMTEKELIEVLTNNGEYLEFMPNQTEAMCLAAVYDYPFALEFVKSQTENICLVACLKNKNSFKLVKNQTSKLKNYFLAKFPHKVYMINELTNIDEKYLAEALKYNQIGVYNKIKFVSSSLKKYAISLRPKLLNEQDWKSADLLEMVKENAATLEFISNPTAEMIKIALTKSKCNASWTKIEYATNCNDQSVFDLAIEVNPSSFQYIPENFWNLKMIKEALTWTDSPDNISLVHKSSKWSHILNDLDFVREIVSDNIHILKFSSCADEELYRKALKDHPEDLIYVHNQTIKLCLMAIRQEPGCHQFVKIVDNPDYITTYNNLMSKKMLLEELSDAS